MKNEMKRILSIGCVADDFTGATDAASFLSAGGLNALLLTELPKPGVDFGFLQSYDAVVIARKIRTASPAEAIAETDAAFRWLSGKNVRQLYFKYCSTFDSTPQGNIGPVLDHLLETFNQPYTILCPALPVNGRTVKNGELLVDGVPLHLSAMKDHPLTPMWDSRLERLMEPQSQYPCFALTYDQLSLPAEEIAAVTRKYMAIYRHFYLAVDYFNEEHGEKIAALFGNLRLLSGGSGLLAPLARRQTPFVQADEAAQSQRSAAGHSLILAGSCSKATQRQVQAFIEGGGTALKVEPKQLIEGTQTTDTIWRFIERHQPAPVLIYSTDTSENVRCSQAFGKERIAELLEKTMAALGRRAADAGFTALIVAGGETSGAVVQALGGFAYGIGASVSPGVPVLYPLDRQGLTLILKSGNFGAPDFFFEALSFAAKGG